MAFTFFGPPPDNIKTPVVDHIDGNTRNNAIENLRWVSQSDNMKFHNFTGNKKITLDQKREIYDCRPINHKTLKDLANEFGVSRGCLCQTRRGRSNKGGASSNRQILTPKQIAIVRAWKPHNPTAPELARKYHVSKTTILNIWRGEEPA